MSTGLLEQRANYQSTDYEYGYGGSGNNDADNNGRKEIDCSHLLNKMVQGAGYQIPYQTTAGLNSSIYYDVIESASVRPGDVALWNGTHNHTGVVESFDSATNIGRFFGSQSSTGPASARFGPGSGYWPTPSKFLRPKSQYRTIIQANTANNTSTAVQPNQNTPASAINFQYPIRRENGSQFEHAEEIFKLLERETSGHFLLSNHGFWHGGIHISEKSAPHCKLDEPIRCMADGEVVAYRLNRDYQVSTYQDRNLNYSSSFCLVRHQYESPKNETEGPNKGKQNKLTFYTLYMHLLPYDRYPVGAEEVKRRVRVTASSLRARSEGNLMVQALGYVETGAELEIISVQPDYKRSPDDTITYELAEALILRKTVKDGNTIKAQAGDTIWMALSQQEFGGAATTFTVDIPPPERKQPEYWEGRVQGTVIKEVNARQAPTGDTAGQPIGLLAPMSTELEFNTGAIFPLIAGGQRVLMAECRLISGGLKGAGSLPNTFWVCVENRFIQRNQVFPTQFDSVVSCSVPVKAGDPIGFLGLYETPNANGGKTSKHQVHVELFTSDPQLEDFLNNTAALTGGKQYLRVSAGTQLSVREEADTNIPTPVGRVLAVDHVFGLSELDIFKDPAGDEWFALKIQDGSTIVEGYVAKEQAEIVSQHDWRKLGFTVVKEENANADGFLDPDQMPAFFTSLYREIDQLGNGDGTVCSSELAAALRDTVLRERWSKLVSFHPTEWHANSDQPKWQRLEKLLEDSPDLLQHEQGRIDNLVFWDQVSSLDPSLSNPFTNHFHPIAALQLFMQRSQLIEVDRFIERYVAAHGLFNAQSPAFSENSKVNLRKVVEHINRYYHGRHDQANVFELAYMFATARHEAWHFISAEYFSTKPEIGNLAYFNKYDPVLASTQALRDRAIAHENTIEGDGYRYRGRGLVHLTWKVNYRRAKEHFGVDFLSDPDKASEFEHSIPIMIWGMKNGIFTGRKLADYINAANVDYASARRIINGVDQQHLIAGYALRFEAILRETSTARETFTP